MVGRAVGSPPPSGGAHSATLISAGNLAKLLRDRGALDEAEPLAREAVELTEQDSPELPERRALLEEILALQADTADKPAEPTRASDDG